MDCHNRPLIGEAQLNRNSRFELPPHLKTYSNSPFDLSPDQRGLSWGGIAARYGRPADFSARISTLASPSTGNIPLTASHGNGQSGCSAFNASRAHRRGPFHTSRECYHPKLPLVRPMPPPLFLPLSFSSLKSDPVDGSPTPLERTGPRFRAAGLQTAAVSDDSLSRAANNTARA
jgi:hypothetical protein